VPESLNSIFKFGYESIALLLFLEAIGLPIPGGVVLLGTGAAAATGVLHPGTSIIVALMAMLAGDSLLYIIGRKTGWGLLGFLCRLTLNPETCILRSAESFYERGRAALVVAKFLPGINTMAPPLAGSMLMPVLLFLPLDLAGASLYTFAFWLPGFLFSELLKTFLEGMRRFGTFVEWIALIGLVIYATYRFRIYWKSRKFGAAPHVDVTLISALMNAPNPPPILLADVRSHGYYDHGAIRIKGSIRLDPNTLPSTIPTLPKEKKIYLYCT
jgi:membrane protein DedA with SNARE-associated domain